MDNLSPSDSTKALIPRSGPDGGGLHRRPDERYLQLITPIIGAIALIALAIMLSSSVVQLR